MAEPGGPYVDSRWSRITGCVDRVVGDKVFVKCRNGEDRSLGGMAAVVWIALDEPGLRTEILERIRDDLPDLEVEDRTVDEALVLLEDNSLVGRDVDP